MPSYLKFESLLVVHIVVRAGKESFLIVGTQSLSTVWAVTQQLTKIRSYQRSRKWDPSNKTKSSTLPPNFTFFLSSKTSSISYYEMWALSSSPFYLNI